MYVLFVNEERTEKVELDERGAWFAARDDTSALWGPPRLLGAENDETREALVWLGRETQGRNRFILELVVELTEPVTGDAAKAAAALVAQDVREFLASAGWGWGVARIEGVYAPARQFAHGDYFAPGEERAS